MVLFFPDSARKTIKKKYWFKNDQKLPKKHSQKKKTAPDYLVPLENPNFFFHKSILYTPSYYYPRYPPDIYHSLDRGDLGAYTA